MASADVVIVPERECPLINPWPWLFGALGAVLTAFVWVQLDTEALAGLRVVLVFGGVVAAGVAVAVRPAASLVVAGAGLTAFVGSWALFVGDGEPAVFFRTVFTPRLPLPTQDGEWDSIRLVLAVAAGVAWGAALIVLLPQLWRRVVVSVLIVVHFAGILSAVLSPEPGPRLVGRAFVYFYRYYLDFMYLNNAYHFYAPEPGPSYFFWFWVEYTTLDEQGHVERDKQGRVITYHERFKVPNLNDEGWPQYPLAIQYQRRLAMASLASNGRQPTALESAFHEGLWDVENDRRFQRDEPMIPHYPNPSLPGAQYFPPTPLSKILVESYVQIGRAHV